MTMSDDGSFVGKRVFSGLSSATCYTQIAGEWRRDLLEILVDNVVIVQVPHSRQDRTGKKEITFSVSRGMRWGYRWLKNVRTYRSTATACRRKVPALAYAFKELSTDGELETEVVFCP